MAISQNATIARKCGVTLGLLLCLALVGCGKGDNKSQSATSSKPSTDAQSQASARPGIKYSTVRVEGTGKSFDDALQNALVLAVGEVNGSRVTQSVNTQSLISDYHSQASSNARFSASESDKSQANAAINAHSTGSDGSQSLNGSANANSQASAQVSGKSSATENDAGSFDADSSVVNASSATSGVVRRFQVASQRQDHGQWYVAIVAEIPVYEASAASKRLKIAVLPFRLSSDDKTANEFEQSVRSQVIDALSQSGKVAVLDRDYTQEDQNELAQLQTEDFSKDEASKLGNKLGADYIIVGTVFKAAATQDSMYMAAVGQRVYGATHADAQLTFRLIEAATGVIQLSGTLNGSQYAASTLDIVAKAEATDLTNRILASLYPLRVESIADGVFYLGKGGDSIHVGDEFRVLRQGSPILDTDTHEVIGYSEKELGKIVVTEVETKLSKAKLADGTTVQIADANGLIARPVDQSANALAGATEKNSNSSENRAAVPKPGAGGAPANGAPKAGVDY